jgi:Zn-dependent peptidase ImmA (M78 family)
MHRVGDELRAGLLDHPRLPAVDQETIEGFLDYAEAYAELERTVLGDLRFDLPIHAVPDPGADLEDEVQDPRSLAETARRLLELDLPVAGLHHALEAHGARVFEMPLSDRVAGAFLFAGEIGPTFLVNSRLTPAAARVALAHLYGHFLADRDPYRPEICMLGPEVVGRSSDPTARLDALESETYDEEDQRERRADRFAAELLMPESLMGPLLEAGTSLGTLADYLDLPLSVVAARVRALRDDEEITGGDPADLWGDDRGTIYPERLVRMALEGIHEDKLDVDDVAAALRIPRTRAIELLRLSAAPGTDGPTSDNAAFEGER